MRSNSVLSGRQIHQVLEAFSEIGNNIDRNWTIILFLIGNNMGYNKYIFCRRLHTTFAFSAEKTEVN